MHYLQQSQALVSTYVKEKREFFLENDITTGGFKININKLSKELHLELVLFEILKPYGFSAWNNIKDLLTAQSGKKVTSATYTLLKDREHLLLYKNTFVKEKMIYEIHENDNSCNINSGTLHFDSNKNNETKSSNINITIDKALIEYPLIVRKWQKGDYFYPSGMQGKKKLSKYFKDEKFSIPEKKNTWLLCSKNQIIWVLSKRMDRRFEVTTKTINSIKITYEINK